jgi:TonB-dependent receptor
MPGFIRSFSLFRLLLGSTLLLTLSPTLLLAQATTGVITGRVSDASTGRSLRGAVVRVLGTVAVEYTDAEGRFTLPVVPAGSQRLEVDYVGLDPAVRDVEVQAGATTHVQITLSSEALQMETFEVQEQARGAALAVNQQKTARGIVNIVSEETFGSMISGNIGYALQRLPGLTVNEDEDGTPTGVNIRGLESKYNSFQVDGNRVPTSGNTRSFATNQFTADGVSNIEVIKAPTPDRDGDAIGGIINVVSRSAFQREGRTVQVTGSGQYYDKNQKWGYNAGLNYLDIFDIAGGTKNLGISLSATAYETSRDYDNLDKDYAYMTPAHEPALNLAEPIYFHTNGTPQTNFRDTKSYGFNASIDFRLTERASFYVRPFYSHYTVDSEKPRNRFYVNSNHNFGGTGGTKSIIEATYNTGRSAPNVTNDIRYQNERGTTDNDTYGLSLGGHHQLDTIEFSYDAFHSKNEANRLRSLGYVVRNPGFNIGYDQTNRAAPVYTILNGRDPMNPATISRGDLTINPREAAEEASSLKADWEKKFVGNELTGSVKIGAKYRRNEKDQDQASRVYRTGTAANGFPYAELLRPSNRSVFGIPMYLEPDMAKVEALFRSSPQIFTLQVNDTLRNDVINDYEAQEDIAAAYMMGTLTWGRTTMIAGLRAEHNQFESLTYRYSDATPSAPTRVRRERDYTVWLPGLHFRHALTRNLILRESYNRSYSRPDIDLLVAGLQLDAATGNISGGNPDLTESTSDNFDIQLEYYTARSGLYSVGFFYKDIKGFYYDSTTRFNEVDADGYPIPVADGAYTFTRPENARGAENYGVELIARQALYFLPKPLDGFSVSISATFTESDGKYPGREDEKLPTYGFSDEIYYAALEYTAGRFRAQLSYRYRSAYLEGLDDNNTLDDYFGAAKSLDWESSYQLTAQVRLFLNVHNLTDEPQVSYQGFRRTDNPEDYTKYSWRAVIGATCTF